MPEPFLPPGELPPPEPMEPGTSAAEAALLLPPDLQAVEDALFPRLRALSGLPAPEVERRLLLLARARAEGVRRQQQARRLAERTRRASAYAVRPLAAAALLLVAALVAGRNAPHAASLVTRQEARGRGFEPAARVLSAEGALGRDNQPKRAGASVSPDEPLAVRPGGHLLLQLPCGTKLGLDGGTRGRLRFDPRTRRMELLEGRVWADVVPIARGPDPRPLLFDTPSGRARVIGTELTLRATPARTLVGVRHGQVRLEGARGATLVETAETGLLAEGFPPQARRTGAIERQFRWIGKLQPRAAHPCERPTGGGPIGEDEAALGRLVARLSDGRQVPLRLTAQDFQADVVDGVVRVTATCTFQNHTSQSLEGTFSLQLPQQASIARYAVTIDGQLVEGTVVERERARAIYEEAKRRMDDPGLLEWAQGNVFTAKVTPIEPHAPKTIVIGWVEELPERDGVMRLVLPLVSGASQETPPERLSIEVRLRGELVQAPFRCPSHYLRARQEPDARVLGLSAEGLTPRNDFVLELYRGGAPTVEAALEPGQAFAPATALVRLRPQLGALLEEELPERVAVVLDASRSQAGTLKEVQLELLEALLQALPARARPRVFLLHVGLEELAPPPAVAPGEGLLAAVWQNEPAGGADYGRGFQRLGHLLPPDWGGVVVLVGDGLPSCGEREPSRLAALFARALPPRQVRRVVTVGLGSAVDEALLGRLARERAGVHVGLRPGDDLSRKLDEVLGALTRPVLSQVQVELLLDGLRGRAVARELAPRRPRSVRAGEALTVLARVPGEARTGQVLLSGVVNGRSFRLRAPFSLRRAPAGAGLDGLWARKRVQDLLEEGPARKPEVLALALDHGIVTPFTSLLVLPEDKRASYAVEEQARRRERRIAELLAETRRLLDAQEDQPAADALEQLSRLAGERPDVQALSAELAARLGPLEPEEAPVAAHLLGGEGLTLLPLEREAELALGPSEGPAGFVRLNAKSGEAVEETHAERDPERSQERDREQREPERRGRELTATNGSSEGGIAEANRKRDEFFRRRAAEIEGLPEGSADQRAAKAQALRGLQQDLHAAHRQSPGIGEVERATSRRIESAPDEAAGRTELARLDELFERRASELTADPGAGKKEQEKQAEEGALEARLRALRAARGASEVGDPEDLQRSLEAMTRALEQDPARVDLLAQRAKQRLKQGDAAGALADLDRALALDPQDQRALLGRAAVRERLGDRTGAQADAELAVTLGRLMVLPQADPGAGKKEQEKQAGESPLDERLRRLRRDDWEEWGDEWPADAERDEHSEDWSEDWGSEWGQRAKQRLKQGDAVGALADLDRALAVDPRDQRALLGRAAVRERLGDRTGALADAERASALGASREALNQAGVPVDTGTAEVEKPIIILEEEVELTQDVPKGTDLSKLSNKRLADAKDAYGVGGGGAGAYGERFNGPRGGKTPAPDPEPPLPPPPPPPAPRPAARGEPAPLREPERKPATTTRQERVRGAAPPQPSKTDTSRADSGAKLGKEVTRTSQLGEDGAQLDADFARATDEEQKYADDKRYFPPGHRPVEDAEPGEPPSLKFQTGPGHQGGAFGPGHQGGAFGPGTTPDAPTRAAGRRRGERAPREMGRMFFGAEGGEAAPEITLAPQSGPASPPAGSVVTFAEEAPVIVGGATGSSGGSTDGPTSWGLGDDSGGMTHIDPPALQTVSGAGGQAHGVPAQDPAAALDALKKVASAESLSREGDKDTDSDLDYGALFGVQAGREGVETADGLLGAGTKQGYRFRREVAEGQVARLAEVHDFAPWPLEEQAGFPRVQTEPTDAITIDEQARARLLAEAGLERATVELTDRYRFSYSPVPVLLAARDLPAGARISADDIMVAEVPSQLAMRLQGVLVPLNARGALVHAFTRVAIKQGEPFQRGSVRGDTTLKASLQRQLQALQAAAPEDRPRLFEALQLRCLDELARDAALQAWLAGELLQWAPQDLDLHEARGEALLAQGLRVSAWRAFSGLVEASPDDAQAHRRYAQGLLRLGLVEQALSELAEAARLAPGEPVHRFALARLAWRQGLFERAEQAYLELLGLGRPDVTAVAKAELEAVYAAAAAAHPGRRAELDARRAALRAVR